MSAYSVRVKLTTVRAQKRAHPRARSPGIASDTDLLGHKENVIGPRTNFVFFFVVATAVPGIDFSAVTELVAVLVRAVREPVIQTERHHAQRWQIEQLIGLGNAVMVFVNPDAQA